MTAAKSSPAGVQPVFPKFDFDAVIAFQKGNMETMVSAQKIFLDLFQTVAKRQAEVVKYGFGKSEAMIKTFDATRQPAEYMDEARAAMEKAMADAKETMDLGMKAQTEVVDLLVARATQNFDEVRSLTA